MAAVPKTEASSNTAARPIALLDSARRSPNIAKSSQNIFTTIATHDTPLTPPNECCTSRARFGQVREL